ncbi:MAG: GxxExxY protein [Pyrinomonadaceae bacterium]
MLYEDLTGKILEGCFEVSKELGIGFIESVYEKALVVALEQKGLKVKRQVPLNVHFRSVVVGEFFVDVLVENKVLIELKAVKSFAGEHFAQTINYLKATGIEVGLIVNFGNPKLEYRRFNNRFLEEKSLKGFFKN